MSPAIKKNQHDQYWFDVRETILSRIPAANEIDSAFLFVRIVTEPSIFIALSLSKLQTAMNTHFKTESTGDKVWSFLIKNKFSQVLNKKSPEEMVKAESLDEAGANVFLQKISSASCT